MTTSGGILDRVNRNVSRVASAVDLRDCVGIVGVGMVAVGIGVVFWPAAAIVVGVGLITLSLWGVRRGVQ